jgi:hypothetical protein
MARAEKAESQRSTMRVTEGEIGILLEMKGGKGSLVGTGKLWVR